MQSPNSNPISYIRELNSTISKYKLYRNAEALKQIARLLSETNFSDFICKFISIEMVDSLALMASCNLLNKNAFQTLINEGIKSNNKDSEFEIILKIISENSNIMEAIGIREDRMRILEELFQCIKKVSIFDYKEPFLKFVSQYHKYAINKIIHHINNKTILQSLFFNISSSQLMEFSDKFFDINIFWQIILDFEKFSSNLRNVSMRELNDIIKDTPIQDSCILNCICCLSVKNK